MNQQIIAEYKRATTSTDNLQQLRIEKEFRFFLLHLLDTSNENIELVNSITPLYQSELTRIKKNSQSKKDKEFSHILKLFTDGDEPVNIGVELSNEERRFLLLSLLPTNELDDLRNYIAKMDLPTPLFKSMAHTFAFYNDIVEETNSLEKRLQTVRDIRHFNPESTDVFIPARPQSCLSTNRNSHINDSNKIYSMTSTIRVQPQIQASHLSQQSNQTKRPNTARPSTSISINRQKTQPKTPRLTSKQSTSRPYSSNSSNIPTPRFRSSSKIDKDIEDTDNATLRRQIEIKEKEIQRYSNHARQIKQAIDKRIRDSFYIQKEIELLQKNLEDMKKEEINKQKEQTMIDESAKDLVSQRKKEANEVTTKLRLAIEENRRLKEQEAAEERRMEEEKENSYYQ